MPTFLNFTHSENISLKKEQNSKLTTFLGSLSINRKNIILTKNKGYKAKNAWVVNTIEEALKLTEGDSKPFIIGGGEIYRLFLSHADVIELTRVHGTFEADTFFPEIDYKNWELVEEEKYSSSVDQPYDYSFMKFRKIN